MGTLEIIEKAEREVSENFDFFQRYVRDNPALVDGYKGKTALLHKRELIDFFDTEEDTIGAGRLAYGEGGFSVQEVGAEPVELGYQSYVLFSHLS